MIPNCITSAGLDSLQSESRVIAILTENEPIPFGTGFDHIESQEENSRVDSANRSWPPCRDEALTSNAHSRADCSKLELNPHP